eukprot:m.47864 g.47864  ORF g.47864 m.47864 type:complete len:78 (+) comp13247_c0_seq11:252-485(+)
MTFLLRQGHTVEHVLSHFHASLKEQTLKLHNVTQDQVKLAFKGARNRQLQEALPTWLDLHGQYAEAKHCVPLSKKHW